ncbi:glyoxylate/hydroxypyruvate reductase A [Pseudooceanicola sp. CBS1P-1]|uniref:Glyoxylate/hydroxypyruvate reductase A n=1 Tax=Pseudooceanicola albus TaxID=2692189 RepID=A0A6L7G8E4_9RHOB|nr:MULTISPECIES: NAD(P)-dependent oxidoreductase [Pseudooceanicola]MBT9386302.1 glyoxylate/hydroxypyruvate reductase A [Pseudooceanicola endophyticus]MXN20351.1 glyoxylate/hydroxypyruvate reductase A [Pseudooceanicola albus]
MTTGPTILMTDPLAWKPAYQAAFRKACPGARFLLWRDAEARVQPCDVLLAWQLPPDMDALPEGVQRVICFGAGTDRLSGDPRLPAGLELSRLVDPDQARQMADYALLACMARQQRDQDRLRDQSARRWPDPRPLPARATLKVTVLGLGRIGAEVAAHLSASGFDVHGLARRPRTLPGVSVHTDLAAACKGADVLVNLLPLTPETTGLLNAELFDRLAPGAYLAQAGRGAQLDEGALRAALDRGHLGAAFLDVFGIEPLPSDHWMWDHPGIRISPHCAAIPSPEGMAHALAAELATLQPTPA